MGKSPKSSISMRFSLFSTIQLLNYWGSPMTMESLTPNQQDMQDTLSALRPPSRLTDWQMGRSATSFRDFWCCGQLEITSLDGDDLAYLPYFGYHWDIIGILFNIYICICIYIYIDIYLCIFIYLFILCLYLCPIFQEIIPKWLGSFTNPQ